VLTVYEVFKKVRRERGIDDAFQVAGAMLQGQVVDLDASIALEAGQLDLPLADSVIYATALRHGATLWTQDRDFEGLAQVKFFPPE
jgi:predicted nucleic acid-binding protein